MADSELTGIVLRLGHAFGQRFVPGLGLDDGQFVVAIDEHVIGGQRLTASALSFDASERDGILAQDAAAFDDAPARRFQCRINVFGSSLSFVHGFPPPGTPISRLAQSQSFLKMPAFPEYALLQRQLSAVTTKPAFTGFK